MYYMIAVFIWLSVAAVMEMSLTTLSYWFLAIVLFLVIFMTLIEKQKEKRKFANALDIINKHLKTLVSKRRQLLKQDDYGNYLPEKWANEVHYFVENVLNIDYPQTEKEAEYFNKYVNKVEEMCNKYIEEQESLYGNNLIFDKNMTPYEYEYFCKDILVSQGYKARVTQGSGDQGVDVIVDIDESLIAIQCKMFNSPVGNKAVQEVFSAKQHIGADKAFVVTNNTYTKSAKELAHTTGVILLHHDDLRDFSLFIN